MSNFDQDLFLVCASLKTHLIAFMISSTPNQNSQEPITIYVALLGETASDTSIQMSFSSSTKVIEYALFNYILLLTRGTFAESLVMVTYTLVLIVS